MAYDIVFFEALGEENQHLHDALESSKKEGKLPKDLCYYIGTETLQEFLSVHPGETLPNIISIKTHSQIPQPWLESGCKKSILSRSAGYDHVEHLATIANVTSLREYCVNAVAETAVKLMFSVCGNLNQYTANTALFERDKCISFKELTGLKVTVFGCGKIGKRIYDMVSGLGMDTYAVDIRAEELKEIYGNTVRFISPDDATDSDVIICAMNYTKDPASRLYNHGYFTEEYLSRFPDGLVFVNVTRGEIAPEAPLLKLYKTGKIFGIGLDAFCGEAALVKVLRGQKNTENENEDAACQIIAAAQDRSENFYVQAHQGFNSDKAALCKAVETIHHLENFYARGCNGFDSQLPYYL